MIPIMFLQGVDCGDIARKVVFAVFAISVSLALSLVIQGKGEEAGMKAIRTEAVERGYAEWVPDKEGNTTFKWKEVAK